MKINIVVELENENYCNGCPCLGFDRNTDVPYCRVYDFNELDVEFIDCIRLDICKEQNKEVHNG